MPKRRRRNRTKQRGRKESLRLKGSSLAAYRALAVAGTFKGGRTASARYLIDGSPREILEKAELPPSGWRTLQRYGVLGKSGPLRWILQRLPDTEEHSGAGGKTGRGGVGQRVPSGITIEEILNLISGEIAEYQASAGRTERSIAEAEEAIRNHQENLKQQLAALEAAKGINAKLVRAIADTRQRLQKK